MKSHATPGLHPAIAWVGLAALTLFVAHPASAAWPTDPFTNVRLAPTAAQQLPYSMVSDGAGGSIVVWYDFRNGSHYDIYAQRVTASGVIAPGWPASGLAVCTATGDQVSPVATSDGSGGAVIAWQDERAGLGQNDIYAMRVNANGTLHPSWPTNGRNLSILSPTNNEFGVDIVSDGSGGAIVAWTFVYTSFVDWDLYAAHVSPLGVHLWEVAVSAPSGFQAPARLCTDGAGGAIVTFADNFSGNYEIKAARVRNDGFLPWGIKDVCVNPGQQDDPVIASDGSGGAVIAWTDYRNGVDTDVFAQHLNASGNPLSGWNATGNPVCTETSYQSAQSIVSDGGQGAILAWTDQRYATNGIYATRITVGGAPHPGWPVNGVAVTGNSPNKAILVSDGTGGAIVAWTDNLGWDLYASRLNASGVLAPGWKLGGTVISAAGGLQYNPLIVSDGTGGAILAWTDSRFGGSASAAFAQRVDMFGQLGSAEPAITRIKDVPGDQGGHVRVDWNASYLDANPTFGVGNYWIWRQAPVDVALRAVRGGAMLLQASDDAVPGEPGSAEWDASAGRGLYMLTTVNATVFAWEFIASQPASGFPKYSYVAATTRDSLGVSNPYTPFMVQARATAGGAFWSSAPDSGYSADNLAPAVPAPFTGALSGGDMHLHWGPNSESDLAGYRLYRGNSAGFVPSPANLVAAQPDTGYVDAGTGAHYYKLSAVDVHGNESGFALLGPSGTLDVVPEPPLVLALARPAPNPARGASRIDFALPHETRVSLAVHDVAGRAVRRIFDGVLPAGEHTRRWDLRDASGYTVRAGLYFVRLEADGRGLSQRLVVSGR